MRSPLLLLALGLSVACSDPPSNDVAPAADASADTDVAPDVEEDLADVVEADTPDDPDVVEDTQPDDTGQDVAEDVEDDVGRTCGRNESCGDGAVFCRLPPGRCDDPNVEGDCTPRPRACPGALEPVCACDGSTYRNECLASQAGLSIRHEGACPDDPLLCGANEECPEDEFCDCGDDSCGPSQCRARPDGCDDDVAPVCGCDGVTYSNDCERQSAGTCLASEGECPPQACGGILGEGCPEGYVCDLVEGACGVSDLPGTCVEAPESCEGLPADPVCACDGVTYENDCQRLADGAQRDGAGECPAPACGSSDDCAPREYCDLPDGCQQNLEGVCELAPQDCTGEPEDRVCGCDGRTYTNDCERRQAGVGKLTDGPCRGDDCDARNECDRNRDFCELSWCVDPDSDGVCVERPRACRGGEPGEEVCGCDGETYESNCHRQMEGVPLFGAGTCSVCRTSDTCGRGRFCEFAGGDCGSPRSTGLCAVVPSFCPQNVDPVCGCNGRTYSNDCARRRAGVALDHTGPCR